MRSVTLLLVALLVATPLASADVQRESEVMTVVSIYRQGQTLLAWQPSPTAIEYGVYRSLPGVPEEFELIGETRSSVFLDGDAPDSPVDYVVLVLRSTTPPANAGAEPQKGSCVRASASGASITASNCIPASVWGEVTV